MDRTHGFTLIELLIVITIIAVLAGAMVPMFRTTSADAKAAKLVHLVDVLKTACQMYHYDTGEYALEISTKPAHHLAENLHYHEGGPIPGWNGPYINHPLADEDNPYHGPINVDWSMIEDFDLDGDGTVDKSQGAGGNSLFFGGASEKDAKKIDDILDAGIPGNWMVAGKVKYDSTGGNTTLYLIGGG